MTNTDTSYDLLQSLDHLSTELEMPRVPGELESWIRNVREAAGVVADALQQQLYANHPGAFKQIAEEDPESFRRIEMLKEGDRNTRKHFDDFSDAIDRLEPRIRILEPNEAVIDEHLEKLSAQGLAFVVEAKKQELAMRTLFQEALYRQRGEVD